MQPYVTAPSLPLGEIDPEVLNLNKGYVKLDVAPHKVLNSKL